MKGYTLFYPKQFLILDLSHNIFATQSFYLGDQFTRTQILIWFFKLTSFVNGSNDPLIP